ncbi:MAG TPA: hypothetical protein VIC84_00370 [Blastocatellia bacterium]
MRRIRCNPSLVAILTLFFVTPAVAQTAGADVQVRLSLAGGKSVYRTGEPIRLALSFTSDADGYQLNVTTTKPASPVDEIALTPDEGVFHWLDEYSGKHRYAPDYMMMQKITTAPVIVELTLNDLVRFDRPGKYTVQVKTARVSRAERPRDPVPAIYLTTNEVSFEVAAMTEAEEEKEVRRLSALLDAARNQKEGEKISEELSYLAGEASTREKARRYVAPDGRSGNYYQDIYYGLFIARDRALLGRLLELALRDPNTPATHQLLNSLTRLRLLQEGKEPTSVGMAVMGASPEQLEIQEEYLRELAASLQKRIGKNRTTTAMTILLNAPKESDRAAPLLSDARKILLQEFDSLSVYDQELLLNGYWDKFRDPSLQPALERMLRKERQPQGSSTRATALRRLIELDPDRSRSFVVAELRDPDSFVDVEILGALKDETLPEADTALLEQIRRLAPIKQGRDSILLRQKTILAARYASPAIYEGLLEVYQDWGAIWEVDARAGLLGYLARYNEARAAPLIEQSLDEMASDRGSSFLLTLTRSIYPKAVDEYLRKRLESDDPQWVGSAAYIMSQRGPADDMQLIEARLDRWLKEWKPRGAELDAAGDDPKAAVQRMMQVNLITALMMGKAWKLPEEKIKQLEQGCVTKTCRQYFHIEQEVKK